VFFNRCVAAVISKVPRDDRPSLLKCMDVETRCNIFERISTEVKIECLFAMHSKDRSVLLNGCDSISKQDRTKIEKSLKLLDAKRAKTTQSSGSSGVPLPPPLPEKSRSPFQRVLRVVSGGSMGDSSGLGSFVSSSGGVSGLGGRKKAPALLSQEALMKYQKQQEKEAK
jgi:hypothetical protein